MDSKLAAKIDAGENILAAPVGTESEFQFPIKDIINTFKTKGGKQAVLNGLAMQLPVDSIVSGVTPPPYVLMVLKKTATNSLLKQTSRRYHFVLLGIQQHYRSLHFPFTA